MSIMTMHPPHHPSLLREHWTDTHSEPLPRRENRISLPSIRQAFPDFERQLRRDVTPSAPPTTSPTRRSYNGEITPPEYIHSSTYHKRPFENGREIERTNSVPRLCSNPDRDPYRSASPPPDSRTDVEAWSKSPRASYSTSNDSHTHCSSNIRPRNQVEQQAALSKFSALNLARDRQRSEYPGHLSDGYFRATRRRTATPERVRPEIYDIERSSPYRPNGYHYNHHPSRVQSLSVGSAYQFDRVPVYASAPPPAAYGHQPHDTYFPVRDIGVGGNYEGKQRKRRGNLPKETTDKLRAWFHSHLSHPYPTEEEKQQLMKQTGLQLNQISNWFINARRRQLPGIVANAHAEAGATLRSTDGGLLPSTERIEYDTDGRLLSEDEASVSRDIKFDSTKRRRTNGRDRGDRGSI
ncbi:hypothetical protein F5Y11DRAFT_289325 [Daldinia sp. FL1419]|nr:hypothetical protein F5Y11DRAFT_289325 [Daldinia sp. FL1419]